MLRSGTTANSIAAYHVRNGIWNALRLVITCSAVVIASVGRVISTMQMPRSNASGPSDRFIVTWVASSVPVV